MVCYHEANLTNPGKRWVSWKWRWALLVMLGLPLLCGPAWAQTVMPNGCTEVMWDANTESDLAGYRLYIERDTIAEEPVVMAKDETMKLCADLPIIAEGHSYLLAMTAFDIAGNESVPTAKVSFVWPDSKPATPAGTCVKYLDANDDLQCAVAP